MRRIASPIFCRRAAVARSVDVNVIVMPLSRFFTSIFAPFASGKSRTGRAALDATTVPAAGAGVAATGLLAATGGAATDHAPLGGLPVVATEVPPPFVLAPVTFFFVPGSGASDQPPTEPIPDPLPDDPALAQAVLRVREMAYGWPGGSRPGKA